eukprot:TRINITY_DN6126_c0_g5_i1.p1 TRINITY_DN6126_c0_g5~~TRINITY_DN6126_c0_g5_i1.p1  ORF type:complete len:428 (+),score=52.97 TRINITY_DN6126_c0_g5_i1:534-1817(+)
MFFLAKLAEKKSPIKCTSELTHVTAKNSLMTYAVLGIVFGYKLLSTFLDDLVPAAFAERSVATHLLEDYHTAMEAAAFVVILFMALLYNALFPLPGQKMAVLCVGVLLGISLFVVWFPPTNSQAEWFTLFVVFQVALFLLANIATAWSVSTTFPLSRYKALGTALIQLLHLGVLFLPHIFASTPALLVILFFSTLICLWGVMTCPTLDPQKEGDDTENKLVHGVSLASAISFILVCFVGLNGEQILDASLKLKLRVAHWGGDRGPIALNHVLTATSRVFAFGMSSENYSPSVLMGIWATTQLLRLMIMGANADLSSLWITGGLILLDKWSGTLGEIALETALLRKLHDAPKGFFPALYLMALYQPIEDITGTAAKVFVRSGMTAQPDTFWNLFQEFKGPIVAVMVISIFVVVWKWTSDGKRSNMKKD